MLHDLKQEGSCYLIKWGQEKEATCNTVPTEILHILQMKEVFHDTVGGITS